MRISLVAVGDKMPAWVTTAVAEYSSRLPGHWHFQSIDIAPARRAKNSVTARLVKQEADRILTSIPAQAHGVALAIEGQHWDTVQLAGRLDGWLGSGRDIALVIGGPDGLAPDVLKRCDTHWSLARLTFPHALVRVLVVEQLYRAWSILNHHPYHRA